MSMSNAKGGFLKGEYQKTPRRCSGWSGGIRNKEPDNRTSRYRVQ